MESEKGLLHGLLVVELASVLAGPSVGQFFAELGAKVLKLENVKTKGDVTRTWKLPVETEPDTVSAYFSAANWGKESICLDLTSGKIRELVHRLVAKADIVLVSFKPGDAEKLRMDYPTLAQLNSRLLYGHITGYGSEVARAGYDAVLQAEAGFMYLNGEPDGPPVKLPIAFVDLLVAHQLKQGILAALYQREKTGRGSYIDVSLARAAIASLANQATNYLVAGQSPKRMGSEHPTIVPYGTVFKTADGKEMVLAVGDDRQFKRLCSILRKPDLADDERYRTNQARVLHRELLTMELAGQIAKFNRAELMEVLIGQHVPAGAVHSVPEALAQPQIQEQLFLDAAGVPKGIRQVAFSGPGQKARELTPPPQLGHHTWASLREWTGVSQQQIADLEQEGLLYGSVHNNDN
jgi:crotonobetainyl-CoA:carnitine CoA-transferase CaiB-like acyl-CoA transferase